MTEQEIKESLVKLLKLDEIDRTSYQAGINREANIANIAHELYTKLITAPSDLREKIAKVMPCVHCESCYLHKPKRYNRKDCVTYEKRLCALEEVYVDKIHSAYIQAGWKNPEEIGQEGDYWIWMDDGEDHLDSLICPILIKAEQLKALIEQAKKEARKELLAELDRANTVKWKSLENTSEAPKHCGLAIPMDKWQALKGEA